MTAEDRQRWDRKFAERSSRSPGPPSDWLVEQLGALPRGGRALDLAAGDGCNSLLLASRGWKVTAVDISEVGLSIGEGVAGPLPVEWIVADLDEYEPPAETFDLVLCFRFLDRTRLPGMVERALKPGGLFLAATFNWREAERPQSPIHHPDFLLRKDEWPTLMSGLEILEHDQSGTISSLIARKESRVESPE